MDGTSGQGMISSEIEVALREVAMGAGSGHLHFDLRLPWNYRINPTAPFELTAEGDGGSVEVTGGLFRLRTGDPSFPITIPLQLHPGSGYLRIRIMVYYCELPRERLCYYQSFHLRAPILIDDHGGPPEARVVYQMEVPSGPI